MYYMNLYLYLDPGTGSLLLYAIFGIATTLIFLIKRFFAKLKMKLFGKVTTINKHYEIVFHSEGSRYFSTFKNVVNEFINHKQKITYITAQKDDVAFKIKSPYFEVICPGNEYQTYTFLNNLDADLVISTTPHLDIYMWKKSKKVKKYIHIFHSPTSIDFYEKYALSYYDIIMTAVKQTETAQKFLDKKRNLPLKEYYAIGCTYLDDMLLECKNIKKETSDLTVLYAPSWGNRSSLNTIGKEIISSLLLQNVRVIFRPHPQSFISDKELINSIFDAFKDNNFFTTDTNSSGLQSMVNSDALITDFSGILFDYNILFKKPIFLASENINFFGYEIEDLSENMEFDIPYAKENSIHLTLSNISNIKQIIKNYSPLNKSNNYIYNLGTSSKILYETINKIWKEIQ